MLKRKLIVAAALTMGAASMPSPAAVDVDIRITPPLPRIGIVAPTRIGYVWVPGFWRQESHRHVWQAGYWMHGRQSRHMAREHQRDDRGKSGRREPNGPHDRDFSPGKGKQGRG